MKLIKIFFKVCKLASCKSDEYLTPRVEKIVEWIKSHYDVEIELSIPKFIETISKEV